MKKRTIEETKETKKWRNEEMLKFYLVVKRTSNADRIEKINFLSWRKLININCGEKKTHKILLLRKTKQ